MQDYSKKSKAERRRLRKELKAASKTPLKIGGIPLAVTKPAENVEDEGERYFTVGHQFYKDGHSTIKTMPVSPLRKVFEIYRNMSRCIVDIDIYGLPHDIKKITIAGHYKPYAAGLTPDVELNEFDAGGYRGFFFIDSARKIIQMVAVDVHPEDKKQTK